MTGYFPPVDVLPLVAIPSSDEFTFNEFRNAETDLQGSRRLGHRVRVPESRNRLLLFTLTRERVKL